MNVEIISAKMQKDADNHYLGSTIFKFENQKSLYEITFASKRGKEWDYSLSFAKESGSEEEMLIVDQRIEEDDDLFDLLLDAALDTLNEA